MVKADASNSNILILEDNPLSLAIVSRLIEQLGYKPISEEKYRSQKTGNGVVSLVLVGIDPENKENDSYLNQLLLEHPEIPVIGMIHTDISTTNNQLDAVIHTPLKRKELATVLSNYLDKAPHPMSVDLTYLQQVSNGDPRRIAELLEIHIQDVPVTFEKMNQGLSQGQLSYVSDLAHKLQSNYKYLGAEEMAQMAEQVELVARSGEEAASLPSMVKNLQNNSIKFSESLDRIKRRMI